MGRYATYDDCDALSPGKLTEDQFDTYLPSAEAYINVITHHRAETASGYKAERVKHAVIAVIAEMAAQDAAKNADGVRLTSVSNDGYSESYGAAGNTASDGAQLRSAAFRWLSGTGLVSLL